MTLETFTQACFEAAEFADCGPDQETHEKQWHEETHLDLEADCRSFYRRFACYFESAGGTDEQAGHDFWLTRQGHGAGCDWSDTYQDMLTKGAQSYGEFTLYVGDDGKVYG